MIPVSLIACEKVDTFGLLDSGAVFSIFKPSLTDPLGIALGEGGAVLAEGISGKISVYLHEIEMEIEGIRFGCKVGFSSQYSASVNIVGREDFFEQFLITFDEKNRRVLLE